MPVEELANAHVGPDRTGFRLKEKFFAFLLEEDSDLPNFHQRQTIKKEPKSSCQAMFLYL
jgi:hypothetical protein